MEAGLITWVIYYQCDCLLHPLKAIISHACVGSGLCEADSMEGQLCSFPVSTNTQFLRLNQSLWVRLTYQDVNTSCYVVHTPLLSVPYSHFTVVLAGRSVSTKQWKDTADPSSASLFAELTSTTNSAAKNKHSVHRLQGALSD